MWFTWYCNDNYTVRNIKGMQEDTELLFMKEGRAPIYTVLANILGGGGGRLACAPGSYAYEV